MNPTPTAIRIGQVLIAALVFGMVSFAAVATVMAGQIGGPVDPKLATTLFIVIGGLAVSELIAFHVVVRPLFMKQTRDAAAALPEGDRAQHIEQRYLNLTIVAGALAEGVGLFGAATVLLTGRLEALAAPGLATIALLLIFPTQARLDRFSRAILDQGVFPR